MIRRVVMWLEGTLAVALVVGSVRFVWVFAKNGRDDDPYGDARLVMIGGIVLGIAAIAFAVGAAGLHWKRTWSWVTQLLPGAVVAWILWMALWHR
jgi:hypothetical protein